MTETSAAFYDFPPGAFPIRMELLDAVTGKVVWSVTVEEPDGIALVVIPGLGPGRRIARVTLADGVVQEAESGG